MAGDPRILVLALAAPSAEALARLGGLVPGPGRDPAHLYVPLQDRTAEEVLAFCVAMGCRVRGSAVVRELAPGDPDPAAG